MLKTAINLLIELKKLFFYYMYFTKYITVVLKKFV